MIVTAWNSGKHASNGTGYGLRMSATDRDRYFPDAWDDVAIDLSGRDRPVMVNITPSFWRSCTELRHREIGRWLREHGFAPWPRGQPPKFEMQPVGERRFKVHRKLA
jgi:hypothetical protein